MAFGPTSDEDHDAQVTEQSDIEKNVVPAVQEVPADPPQETQAEVDDVPEPVVKLVIAPDADVNYPLTVGLAAGDYTFESADDSFEVVPDVASQIQYVPQVTTEVVE